jgi:hypothetical protein
MLRKLVLASMPTLLILTATGSLAADGDRFTARLRATEETPSVSSPARGRFRATIDDESQTISFELSYEGLEAAPLFAHIHVGQRGFNGGVSVFLCGPPENAAQTCPAAPATITGELTPANIVGPVSQGIDPATDELNGFAELVQLLRSGFTYANVHTEKFPPGEIRGQIRAIESR